MWQSNINTAGEVVTTTENYSSDSTESSNSSACAKTEVQLDIEEILKTSGKRNIVLSFYAKNNKLNESCRKTVAEIVIEYLIHNKIHASPRFLEQVSKSIIKLFKSDIKETYFMKVPSSRPKGVLYQKYHNTITTLRRHELWSPKKLVVNEFEDTSNKSQDTDDICSNTIISTKKWLQFNVEPLDDILIKWKETSNYRKQFLYLNTTNIADIIENWPMYKQAFGNQLIDIDFDILHYEKGGLLFDKWDSFIEKIVPLMKSTIKEANSRELLNQVEICCDTNLDKRNLLIIDLMNSLLVPTCRTSIKDKTTNKKTIVKTSIADGRKAFLLQVPSMNDLHLQIQVQIDDCYKNNQSLQPLT